MLRLHSVDNGGRLLCIQRREQDQLRRLFVLGFLLGYDDRVEFGPACTCFFAESASSPWLTLRFIVAKLDSLAANYPLPHDDPGERYFRIDHHDYD